jgi:hypothetical protein
VNLQICTIEIEREKQLKERGEREYYYSYKLSFYKKRINERGHTYGAIH